MNPEALRITLVIDHPAQHFARAFQLLADEPDLLVHVYYGVVPEAA